MRIKMGSCIAARTQTQGGCSGLPYSAGLKLLTYSETYISAAAPPTAPKHSDVTGAGLGETAVPESTKS